MRAIYRAAAAGAAALGLLAGCASGGITPHSLADGVLIDLGQGVRGQNLMVLTAEQGAPGRLVGALTNDTDAPVTVSIAVQGAALSATAVEVPAHGISHLGPQGTDVMLNAAPQPPGAMIAVDLTAPALGSTGALVPVLDGTLPEYASLVPTP